MSALVTFFLRRHLLVHAITAAAVVFGVTTGLGIQREGFPAVTINRLIVDAELVGASAAQIESEITTPLEDAIAGLDGVEELHSVIVDHRSTTTVEVYDHYGPRQIRELQEDLRQAIEGISDFPAEMERRPAIRRVEAAKMPVIEVALWGPSESLYPLASRLEAQLERLPGVAQATTVGLSDPELRVLVDPDAAGARGVTVAEIAAAMKRQNLSATGGIVESQRDRLQVVVDGEFRTPADVEALVLRADGHGGLLRLGDVARVEVGREDHGLRTHSGGRPGLSIVVRKRVEADILTTVDGVRAALAELSLPPGVDYKLVNDQSFLTRNRLSLMLNNGLIAVVLVVLVLGVFLSRRTALWVALGVPVVLLGVLSLLPLFGLTLNLITLAAFVMVLGMLVDDAVVVAERIERAATEPQPEGQSPELRGVMDVARPVFASALTTVLAFTPMFALGGLPGKVAWALPVVVVLALAMSLLESFFILPAHMASRQRVRSKQPERGKRPMMAALTRGYARLLSRALRFRYGIALLFAVVFVFAVAVVRPSMGFELFPQDDSDALFIKLELPLGTPIERTEAAVAAIEAQLPAIMGDDLMAITARIGHIDPNTPDLTRGAAAHEAVISAFLRPLDKLHSSARWATLLEQRLSLSSAARLTFEPRRVGPPLGRPVTVHVAENDDPLRRSSAHEVATWLRTHGAVRDVEIDERPGLRQLELNPDLEQLARRGLDVNAVAATLRAAFQGLKVGEIRSVEQTTSLRVQFEPSARADTAALLDTDLPASDGRMVPLRDVVTPVEVASVSRIHHRDGVRTATITAGLHPDSGLDAGRMAAQLEAGVLQTARARGADIYQGGEAKQAAKTTADLGRAALLALFGIVAVVAVILGSVLDAVLVVSVIPFGVAGVLYAFWAHGLPLSLFALLGTLGLTGVVVNASIVMLDAVKVQLARDGGDRAQRREVLIGAVVARLRPILVTTLTTLGGVLPTAYGIGGYDAVLSPMSLAIGWGLVFASGITLLLLPCLFAIAEDLRGLHLRLRGPRLAWSLLPLVLAASLLATPASAQRWIDSEPIDEDRTTAPAAAMERLRSQLGRPGGLTAEDVERRALARSPVLAQGRADIERADAVRDRAALAYLPQLLLSASYTRLSPLAQPALFGEGPSLVVSPDGPGPLSADAPLLGLDADAVRFRALENRGALRAGLVIPLSDYLMKTGQRISSAELSRQAASARLRSARARVATEARLLYYGWVGSRLARAVADESLQRAREHREAAQALMNAGSIAPGELLHAEAGLARAELLQARALEREANARDRLHLIMGDDRDSDHAIGEDPLAPEPTPGPVGARGGRARCTAHRTGSAAASSGPHGPLVRQALCQRSELEATHLSQRARAHQQSLERASGYPRLQLVANAYYENPHHRVVPPEQSWRASWDAGIALVWSPNDALTARSDDRAGNAELDHMRASEAELRDRIALEVRQSARALRTAKQAVGSSHRALTAAEEELRAHSERFSHGGATSIDVLDAETDYVREQLTVIEAHLALKVAELRLANALER
ncbi:MAG: efflux RND transporter permease subunit [Myxococcales bacterium]|nr:efflux RND transporter permease subunit [Myxococcales bacterium]